MLHNAEEVWKQKNLYYELKNELDVYVVDD